jgi:hypothetical protein
MGHLICMVPMVHEREMGQSHVVHILRASRGLDSCTLLSLLLPDVMELVALCVSTVLGPNFCSSVPAIVSGVVVLASHCVGDKLHSDPILFRWDVGVEFAHPAWLATDQASTLQARMASSHSCKVWATGLSLHVVS